MRRKRTLRACPPKKKVRACLQRGQGAKGKHRGEDTRSAPKQHKVHATRERKGNKGTRLDTVTRHEEEVGR